MTILNHSQENRTGQQPYKSVLKGSIFRCSPLQRKTVNYTEISRQLNINVYKTRNGCLYSPGIVH